MAVDLHPTTARWIAKLERRAKQTGQPVTYDNFPTPPAVADLALDLLAEPRYSLLGIVDAGAGAGVWGQAARRRWPHAVITGVELRDEPKPDAYDHWRAPSDFLADDLGGRHVDLVIGNPPFGLAEAFVRHGLDLLPRDGWLVFLLRLAFLEGQDRGADFWPAYPARHVAVLSRRPVFVGDNSDTKTAYGIFYWQRGFRGPTTLSQKDWRPARVQGALLEAAG